MNYLQLCQRVYLEGGIAGSISSTQNQTGEALRIATWVASAYTEILNDQGLVWNLVRKSAVVPLAVGVGTYSFTDLGLTDGVQWDPTSMRVALNANLSDETFLGGQRFPEFRDFWLFSSRRTVTSRPINVAVDTDTNLRIAPIPDQAYNLILQYQGMPANLAGDADVPVIPTRFQLAIVWKALRAYGMFESAPEVVVRADMEFKTVMQQLEADQSPQVIVGAPLC
jgi:hypothetical protein